MTLHTDFQRPVVPHHAPAAFSPLASERIRKLAQRAIDGAPALTAGEMRELAEAILEHTARSDRGA